MAEQRTISPEIRAYVERMRVHHKRLYGGGGTHSTTAHGSAPGHSAQPGAQVPQPVANGAGGHRDAPAVRLGSDLGGVFSPTVQGQTAPGQESTFTATQPGDQTGGQRQPSGEGSEITIPPSSQYSNDAQATPAAVGPSGSGPAGPNASGFVNGPPTPEQVSKAEEMIKSVLVGAQGLVAAHLATMVPIYNHHIDKMLKMVEKKIKTQEDTKALVVEMVLMVPFFFGGPILEAGASMIATKVVPKILTKLNGVVPEAEVTELLVKKFASKSRSIGEKALEQGKKELVKSFKVGTDRQVARQAYLNQATEGMFAWSETLLGEIENVSDAGALAFIFGALLAQDSSAFAAGFDKDFSDWSEKVLEPKLKSDKAEDLEQRRETSRLVR